MMRVFNNISIFVTIAAGLVAIYLFFFGAPGFPWLGTGGASNPAPPAAVQPAAGPEGENGSQQAIEDFYDALAARDAKAAAALVVPEKQSDRLDKMPDGAFPFYGGLPASSYMRMSKAILKNAVTFKVNYSYDQHSIEYCYEQAVVSTVQRGAVWLIDSIKVRTHTCTLL